MRHSLLIQERITYNSGSFENIVQHQQTHNFDALLKLIEDKQVDILNTKLGNLVN